MLVDCSVKIRPLALNFYLGFIHPPRLVGWHLPTTGLIGDDPYIFFNLPIERRVSPETHLAYATSGGLDCGPVQAVFSRHRAT